MPGVGVTIRVGGDAPKRVRDLLERIRDQAAFFAAASELMLDATQENFASQSSPEGDAWAPLAPATVEERGSASPILERSGALRAGIHAAPEATRAVVRSLPLPYAAIHQQGGQAGRNRAVTVPARPYLGWGPKSIAEVTELAEEMILGGF